ncbi:MAG: hypothetical protein KGP28_04610 [Bdellovibrionales bacterium]|nr:hypothetical protein [Bdellovibrionales bacterium]
MIFALLVLTGVGTYFYQSVSEKKEQEGKTALYKVQKAFEEEIKAIPESERTPGASFDVDSRFSKTVAELNGILKSRSASDRVLFEAAFRLGSLYLENRQPDKAATHLKEGVVFSKTGIQRASIQFLLGSALEQINQAKEALGAFQDGLSQNVGAMKGDFLLGMMRAHLQRKEIEQAKKISDQISKELSGSKFVEAASQILKDTK